MNNLFLKDRKYILNVYNRLNLEISYGKGSYLYDKENNRYLDMFSGLSVNSFGHNNKDIVSTISSQSAKYIHISNFFAAEPTVKLAENLISKTNFNKIFFSNSGTEAIEGAIKLCRQFGKHNRKNKYKLLSATNSFHGRTFGGLSLTGQKKFHEGFEPILPGIDHFKYNDIEDLIKKCDENVCGVFIEVIQGEGGITEISEEFINELKKLSNKYNFLIVIDEIQTGLGRTGEFLAYKHYNIEPDIVCLSKSLGGGLPLGAILLNDKTKDILKPGQHGSTFGGNPVACAVGNVIVNKLNNEFLSEVAYKSDYLKRNLLNLQEKYPKIINEIRGKGLMLGIECGKYAQTIKHLAINNNLLLNVTKSTVIRLLPPLNIALDEIDSFLDIFDNILNEINKG